jgi:hypothetical protein
VYRRKVKDVGVMKDEEIKLEEIETSHTLVECDDSITNGPVCKCE